MLKSRCCLQRTLPRREKSAEFKTCRKKRLHRPKSTEFKPVWKTVYETPGDRECKCTAIERKCIQMKTSTAIERCDKWPHFCFHDNLWLCSDWSGCQGNKWEHVVSRGSLASMEKCLRKTVGWKLPFLHGIKWRHPAALLFASATTRNQWQSCGFFPPIRP